MSIDRHVSRSPCGFYALGIILTIFIITIVRGALLPLKISQVRVGSVGARTWVCNNSNRAFRSSLLSVVLRNRGDHIYRQVSQFNAEFRESVWSIGECVLVDSCPPDEQPLFCVPIVRDHIPRKIHGSSVYRFWTNCGQSFFGIQRIVIGSRQIGIERLKVSLDDDISCGSVSSIVPDDGDFLTKPFRVVTKSWIIDQSRTQLCRSKGQKTSFRDFSRFAGGIRNTIEKVSENSEHASKECGPSCGFIYKKFIPKPVHEFVLFVFAVFCFLFGIVTVWHGLESTRFRIVTFGALLLILGWYTTKCIYELLHHADVQGYECRMEAYYVD